MTWRCDDFDALRVCVRARTWRPRSCWCWQETASGTKPSLPDVAVRPIILKWEPSHSRAALVLNTSPQEEALIVVLSVDGCSLCGSSGDGGRGNGPGSAGRSRLARRRDARMTVLRYCALSEVRPLPPPLPLNCHSAGNVRAWATSAFTLPPFLHTHTHTHTR